MAKNRITPPEGATIGLDLFAAAWLDRWTSYGGSIQAEIASDRMWSLLEENGQTDAWLAEKHVSATRELIDLLHTVPGGRDAVTAHVVSFPNERGGNVVLA